MVENWNKAAGVRMLACALAVAFGCLAGVLHGEDEPVPPPATADTAPSPAEIAAIAQAARNRAEAEALTDAQVVKAIEHGIDFLVSDLDHDKLPRVKAEQPANRGDPKNLGDVGELMLEAYALLHIAPDLKKDDRIQVQSPRMKLAEDVMLRLDVPRTYETSLQSLALAQMPQTAEVKQAMAKAVKKLVEGRGKAGGYTYGLDKGVEIHDQSNSQYGLLGVWAACDWAEPWGSAAPASYWKGTDEFWRSIQLQNGGWGYGNTPEARVHYDVPSQTMTVAGVASLYVCDEFLNRTPRSEPKADSVIDNGIAAMLHDFDPDSANFYYLYGVERVGLATGRKFFNKIDWYRAMAVNILKRQKDNGRFEGGFMGANDVRSTCYAILLLARGRAPVLMNKLEYDGAWNARPRDSANVHSILSRRTERHLNWQSVPLDVPVKEWLDAPILFIAGAKDPNFTPEDIAKLRQFIVAGGLIFSSPDNKSAEFTKAMKKYAAQVLEKNPTDDPDFPFRPLPADHPLFSLDGKMKVTPKLLGITNGLREVWIHSLTDYGAIWQSRDTADENAWDLPLKLYSYAAGKGELRSKLQPLSVRAPVLPPLRHTTVARLKFNGNWNPEPGAWPRLVKLMAFDANTELSLIEVPVAELGNMQNPPAMAHLAGTGKLELRPEELKSLQTYINNKGLLVVEALGGDDAFDKSARALIQPLFPDSPVKLVPPGYMLYTGSFSADAMKIPEVQYRRYWWLEHGQQTAPRLEFLTVKDRVGVFFSGEDFTSGLLGTNTWGIGGYVPDSAEAIARNLVLYAARNAPKPAVHPGGGAPTGK